jgi:hypothetical protein
MSDTTKPPFNATPLSQTVSAKVGQAPQGAVPFVLSSGAKCDFTKVFEAPSYRYWSKGRMIFITHLKWSWKGEEWEVSQYAEADH